MRVICFIFAILLLLAGHFFKVKRWAQSIEIYEEPPFRELYMAISIGQLINLIFPFRIGDLFRIYISGKKMKNGCKYSFATVCMDIYFDIFTVGIITLISYFIFKDSLFHAIIIIYGIAMIFLCFITIISIKDKTVIKQLIYHLSCIFNNSIKLQIMYSFWNIISSFKDILYKINRRRFLMNTVLIWGCYLFSYFMLSRSFIQMSFSEIFVLLFHGMQIRKNITMNFYIVSLFLR